MKIFFTKFLVKHKRTIIENFVRRFLNSFLFQIQNKFTRLAEEKNFLLKIKQTDIIYIFSQLYTNKNARFAQL